MRSSNSSWLVLAGLLPTIACADIIGADFGSYRLGKADASANGGAAESGGRGTSDGGTSTGASGSGGSSGGASSTGGAGGSGGTVGEGGTGGSGGALDAGSGGMEGGVEPDAGKSGRMRVFVTSLVLDGSASAEASILTHQNVGGLGAADALCQYLADNVALGGTWTAFVSGVTSSNVLVGAVDRIPEVGPWYLVDRTTRIFSSKQAFFSAHPEIDRTETGATVTSPTLVWTGTTTTGTASSNRCIDWADDQVTVLGTCGDSTSTSTSWMSTTDEPCSTSGRLYCFETAHENSHGSDAGSGGNSGSGGASASGGATGAGGSTRPSVCADGSTTTGCPACIATSAVCCKSTGVCGCSALFIEPCQ